MKVIIHFSINNIKFSILVDSFDKIKVFEGKIIITKIKHNSDLNVTEYYVEGK